MQVLFLYAVFWVERLIASLGIIEINRFESGKGFYDTGVYINIDNILGIYYVVIYFEKMYNYGVDGFIIIIVYFS